MKRKPRLLIIDDSPEICELLILALSRQFELATVGTLTGAFALTRRHDHDALIVDVELSAGNETGLDLIRLMRADGDRRPIAATAGMHDPELGTKSYEAGADVFIVKPFRVLQEVAAAVSRLLVRTEQCGPSATRIDGMKLPKELFRFRGAVIDPVTMTVRFADKRVAHLSPKELGLLHLFSTRAGQLVRRAEILQQIWGGSPALLVNSRTVDVHIGRLRQMFHKHRVVLAEVLRVKPKVGWWVSPAANR